MTKIAIPPGYALVRIEDLANLPGSRPAPAASDTGNASAGQATMPALAEAVSLLSARIHGVGDFGLSGDVPPGSVMAALTILARAFLGGLGLRDDGAALLRDLGEAAVRENDSPPGKGGPP